MKILRRVREKSEKLYEEVRDIISLKKVVTLYGGNLDFERILESKVCSLHQSDNINTECVLFMAK